MIAVIDTSALVRLFIPDGPVPDGLEEFFRGVNTGENISIAPDLLMIEAANVLYKKLKRAEISESECDELLRIVHDMPIRLYQHRPLLSHSLDIAKKYAISVYDASYLALADNQGAQFFTADQKLRSVAKKMGV